MPYPLIIAMFVIPGAFVVAAVIWSNYDLKWLSKQRERIMADIEKEKDRAKDSN